MSKIVGKYLKTADIEGKDWRKELEKLLSSRPIKTGLPEIIKPLNYDFHPTARQNELTSRERWSATLILIFLNK